MTKLIRYLDHDYKGRWANIRMDNGDPCWVSIAQTGILVKKSKVGLLGAKLFEEKNIYKAAKTAQTLSEMHEDDLTPDEMWNPVLKSIVNAKGDPESALASPSSIVVTETAAASILERKIPLEKY